MTEKPANGQYIQVTIAIVGSIKQHMDGAEEEKGSHGVDEDSPNDGALLHGLLLHQVQAWVMLKQSSRSSLVKSIFSSRSRAGENNTESNQQFFMELSRTDVQRGS
jgi:hypothetical protein